MYTVFWYNSEESNEYEKEKLTKEISKGEKCHAITGASEQQKKTKEVKKSKPFFFFGFSLLLFPDNQKGDLIFSGIQESVETREW